MGLNVGDKVRVLPPFKDSFTDDYTIVQVTTADDGQTVVYLEGIESAFAPCFLEVLT